MRARAITLPVLSMLLIALSPGQGAAVSYECEDARGRAVMPVEDPALDRVARAVLDPVGGEALIRHNPALLRWIHPATRRFFFFHECARHALAAPLGRDLSPDGERRLDCWAVAELVRRGLLGDEEMTAVQKDLYTFGQEEWARVPGPRRTVDLQGCVRTERRP